MMDILTILITLALFATVVALAGGVTSMVRGGEFDRRHSTQLMFARVGFQGLTLVLQTKGRDSGVFLNFTIFKPAVSTRLFA